MRTCYCVCVALVLPLASLRPEKYPTRQSLEYGEAVNLMEMGETLRDQEGYISLEYDEAADLMEIGENLKYQAGSKEDLELTDTNKVRQVAQIKGLKPVKKIKPIITMDRIQEISPVDADLAEKMKAQILAGGSSSDNRGLKGGDDDLHSKVKRLYKLFDINSLEDIIRVVPIRSIHAVDNNLLDKFVGDQDDDSQRWSDRQTDGGRGKTGRGVGGEVVWKKPAEDAGGDTGRGGGGRGPAGRSRHDRGGHRPGGVADPSPNHKILDNLNRKISVLEDDINARLEKLLRLRQNLVREEDLLEVLNVMLERERAKIDAILQVKRDHLSKAQSLQDSIGDLQGILESSNNVKIRYLTKLEDMADQEKKKQQDRLMNTPGSGDGFNNNNEEDMEEEGEATGRTLVGEGEGVRGYNPGGVGHGEGVTENNPSTVGHGEGVSGYNPEGEGEGVSGYSPEGVSSSDEYKDEEPDSEGGDIEVDTNGVKSLDVTESIVSVKELDPIIHIDNMAKIEDVTYLTDEQGEELKRRQARRKHHEE